MASLFTDKSAKRISRAVRWAENQYVPNNYRQRKRRPGARGKNGAVAKTTTTITAFNDTTSTAGKGTVQPYKLNTDTDVLETSGDTVDVFNMAASIVTDTWIQYKYDQFGTPWIDVELCPEVVP